METLGITNERNRPKRASFIKMRIMIAIMATFCPVVCYISRQNLPFAIVSMVEEEGTTSPTNRLSTNDSIAGTSDYDYEASKRARLNSILGDDLGLLHSNVTVLDLSAEAARQSSSGTEHASIDTKDVEQIPKLVTPSNHGTCPEQTVTDEFGKTSTVEKTRTFGPKFSWSQEEKGLLLGAFFYSYVLFQIPGARLAERMGAKWILVAASLGSALLSFISPWSASVHVHFFSAVRFLMGVFQAALYPTCYVLYSKWLPPVERSQGLPILCVGAYVGSIVASGLTGYFSEQEGFGWEYAFYVPGVMCLLWSIVWIWFGSNEPQDHRFISVEELQYIEARMETALQAPQLTKPSAVAPTDCNSSINRTPKHLGRRGSSIEQLEANSTPSLIVSVGAKKEISWQKLFQSRAIWAMMAAFFASNWSFTIVLLLIPTYLNDILRVSPMQSGMINSIIYILYCIVSPLVGTASTMMVETRAFGLTRLSIRKLFQGVALFGQTVCFIAIALLGCDRTLVYGVLFVQIVFFSLVNGGEVQLPSELSVDFSGTIYAIGNCVGSSTGFIVPIVFSKIVQMPYDRFQWNLYFYLAALISTLGALIFIVFGGNQMQDFSAKSNTSNQQDNYDGTPFDFGKFDSLASHGKPAASSFTLESYRPRQSPTLQNQQQPRRQVSALASLPPLKQQNS